MTTARDIRAMVTSLEKAMQTSRSAKGAGNAVDFQASLSKLEKEVGDARAMTTLARRTGVDAVRLESKIVAAKSLSDKLKSGSCNSAADSSLIIVPLTL